MRWIGIVLLGTLGCTAGTAEAAPCAERVFFRDMYQLYRLAVLQDGYVLDSDGALIGYGMDNEERFRIPGTFDEFAGARDGQLVTASHGDGVVTVAHWSPRGEALGELGELQDPGELDPTRVAILSDGAAIAAGGGFRDWWTGHVAPGQAGRRDSVRSGLAHVVAAAGTAAYALRSTFYDENGALEHLELQRIDADLTPRWTTTIYDRPDDTAPLEGVALLASAGDDAFVVTIRHAWPFPSDVVFRRYGPDGELLWTFIEPLDNLRTTGLPVVRRDGTLLWVRSGPDAIRVTFLDESGEALCDEQVPSDGNLVTDVAMIEDELFVITVDRITRIRLGDPPALSSAP